MKRNRTRALGAVAALAGGVALLTACGQGIAAPEQGGNALTGQAGQPGGAAQEQVAACSADDVDVTLTPQPGRPGVLLLTAVNSSQEACTVDGWADLKPLDMTGSVIDVPTEQVEVPGAPTATRLEPGETAFAGVQLELGSKEDPNVRVATGFSASMPGGEGTTNAHIASPSNAGGYPEFPVTAVQIGSFQPTGQGVTVF
ncbi:DUF4232 domain-containing protein [Saccharopolyspora hordei]|uniref:DUF4232 domain-containing protein n=1 Tax=Saccharopolyspora hordei TaxID=1838 RepID=A0A853ACY4_9PSEU|nr:DUF4232 domain-containing protein [Saccharopolyspora hordei]NYI82314.1 hypothetical protein [Saccharopolyspora hordei]